MPSRARFAAALSITFILGAACDEPSGGDRSCATNSECAASAMCVSGQCREVGEEVLCSEDSECASGLLCRSGICEAAQPGLKDSGVLATDTGVLQTDAGALDTDSGAVATDSGVVATDAGVIETDSGTQGCDVLGPGSCPMGTVCDTTTGACVSIAGPCNDDLDCGPPSFVCVTAQCVPGCGELGGIQCTGTESCDPATGRCEMNTPIPSMCAPDALEPNDTESTARMIGSGTESGLSACGDEDYYRVTAIGGARLRVDVEGDGAEGNIDVRLYDLAGNLLDSALGASSDARVEHEPSSTEEVIVRVSLTADTGSMPGATYEMELRVD